MAGKKKQDKEFEELRRRALEPFKPKMTMEELLEKENGIREDSLRNYHGLKKELTESEKANIKSRADFEHGWR